MSKNPDIDIDHNTEKPIQMNTYMGVRDNELHMKIKDLENPIKLVQDYHRNRAEALSVCQCFVC